LLEIVVIKAQIISKNLVSGGKDREYTIDLLRKIADPVLLSLKEGELVRNIPQRDWEKNKKGALHTSALQAFGRTLSGMAPWLALGEDNTTEGQLRQKYIDLSLKGIKEAVNPDSPDYMFEKKITQHIVHTAYFAYPLLLAKKQLWEPLSKKEKKLVIEALKTHRGLKPWKSNWLLFSAIIECAIWELSGKCEMAPIEYAIENHMEWYLGDGTYGDGPSFHWDYYNSFVIHPLLLEILRTCKSKNHKLGDLFPKALKRSQRYAEILEHLISPEATFPVVGRSSVYRIAVFQLIGYLAAHNELPKSINTGATRAALTAVSKRMMEMQGTFGAKGWLTAGVVGQQINARDHYSYTGALYFCATGLMHLGAPKNSKLWSDPSGKWFQQRVWSGDDIPRQNYYKEPKE